MCGGGSYKSNLICDFVKKALHVTKEKHGQSVILVIDNAPCHSKIKSVLDEKEFSNDQMVRGKASFRPSVMVQKNDR